MKIIDSHIHIYKNAQSGFLAQGGISVLGYNGTLEEALSIIDRCGFSKVVALAVMPISHMRAAAMKKWPRNCSSPEKEGLSQELEKKLQARLAGYNDWLCQAAQKDDRLIPAIACDATIDKNYMEKEILSKIEKYQLKVIKIHPAVGNLFPDDKGYEPIFALAQEKQITVISHGGFTADDVDGRLCNPESFGRVLTRFPRLKLVVAHLAYPHTKEMTTLAGKHHNLYVDLSFVLKNSPLTDEAFCDVIQAIGPDRVLFGSDFPWSEPEEDMERLMRFPLSDEDREMIAWRNAVEVFGLN